MATRFHIPAWQSWTLSQSYYSSNFMLNLTCYSQPIEGCNSNPTPSPPPQFLYLDKIQKRKEKYSIVEHGEGIKDQIFNPISINQSNKRPRWEYLGSCHRTISTSSAIEHHNSPTPTSCPQQHMPHVWIIASTSQTWLQLISSVLLPSIYTHLLQQSITKPMCMSLIFKIPKIY